ncbi:bis(5'-nucleosyl)-tetraphosphatase (asymmetrical) [Lachnospiraceae bacterium KM106-2]|nr:bis(5'-nucleosyl)-tetraphosphatase (asymmetrical) [Lachnospiraceae bacterium KM106-2]
MEDCIFCKIANGEIPSATIYEDNDFRVIMDINPASKGHAIILPKTHAANIFEVPEDVASKIFVVAKKVATAMKEVLNCDGVNVLQNNGEIAGQTVFHLHMHVIPRYEGDQVKIKWSPAKEVDYDLNDMAKEIASKIK